MAIANNDWKVMLIKEFNKPYCKQIAATLNDEYKNYKIHPDYENIFAAFRFTPYEKTKVVILGQDPYHGENQA
ncbi:MAG: uracil-DNA glycosylase, partial [Oscillospiraceae bacterium]